MKRKPKKKVGLRRKKRKVKKVKRRKSSHRLESFDFQPGRILAKKYRVEALIGKGWEGEVYRMIELQSGAERAGKFFYPHRNPNNKALKIASRKLHKLRNCPILMKYHTQEMIWHHGFRVPFLVSEFVEGELLSQFLKRQAGRRLHYFQALSFLYVLARGLESIHKMNEYHGDLHSDNIMIKAQGLGFEIKLIDMHWWGSAKPENINGDVYDLIKLFHELLGGARHYSKQPLEIRSMLCNLRRHAIIRKYRSAGKLREYIESIEWH